LQGVIKSYDPGTGDGVVLCDSDLREYDLAAGSLDGSVFRMVRQGQRVIFDVDERGNATKIRIGSEVDMQTPGFEPRGGGPVDPASDPAVSPSGHEPT
jgi:CspA family cold shock protein